MNAELQRIFDNASEDEPRSRLEPFRDLILAWRDQGRSLRRIRELLAEHCGISVAGSTLCQFLKKRTLSRPLKPRRIPRPASRYEKPEFKG